MDSNQGMPPPEPSPEAEPEALRAQIEANQRADAERVEAERHDAEREAERLRIERAVVEAEAVGGRAHRGLVVWTAIIFFGSLLGFLTGHVEAPVFLAVSGLFALTQSWDVRDRARTGHAVIDAALLPGDIGSALRTGIPMVAPVVGTLLYLMLGVYARQAEASAAHVFAANWCLGAAVLCALMALPPISRGVTVRLMGRPPTHTAQLAASFAMVALLFPVPARLLFDDFMNAIPRNGRPLVDMVGLVVQLACELLFAAAAVGLWVARDFRTVRERLGLHAMRGRDWALAVVGLVAVIALNSGMEWLERERFHALWIADQEIVRMLVGNISIAGALVLGLSAGAGEEILVRGALQPRSGVVWAALLFSAGHVQYTWFGMLTILLLGIALGLVRKWSNTTTVIVVHMLYDVVAALGATHPGAD
jgi:hypothetical protein